MMQESLRVVTHALMITGFVAVMMLVIEYVNVLSEGVWMRALAAGRWRQYVLAAVLGAIPGCLGAFLIVSLYAHRRVTLGAVAVAMIATMGDETFVMLATVPATAAWMIPALALIALPVGFALDRVAPRAGSTSREGAGCELTIHARHTAGACFARGELASQWRPPTPRRAVLTVALALFVLGVASGLVGPTEWSWIRITLLLVGGIGVFIAASVSDHFLDEHLWAHVLRGHVPRIFLWTLGALAVFHTLEHFLDVEALVADNRWVVLVMAVLIGIVPESGPHLVFVTLFAAGKLPLSILLASSVVQDGHGMIPLLAHSRRDFVVVKAVNALVGLAVGAALLSAGW